MARGSTAGSKTGYNLGYVWMISLVAAMGGLLFGYDRDDPRVGGHLLALMARSARPA